MDLCYKSSNNKYNHLPARMDDGRHFTDYRPSNVVHDKLKKDNKIMTTHDVRLFLVHNAENIINKNSQISFINNGSTKCDNSYKVDVVPSKQKIRCDIQSCEVVDNDENGVGLEREYNVYNDIIMPLDKDPYDLNNNICKKNI
jgi:hypothetical protein